MVIQVQNLDLEEQEQIDKLKAFWAKWGGFISSILIVVLLAFSAWRAYDWYTNRQAMQASALFAQLHSDIAAGDMGRLENSLKRMQDGYGGTTYAQHGGLLAAKAFSEKGEIQKSQAALTFVIDASKDKGLKSLARLQLAQLLAQEKRYDDALTRLAEHMEPGFAVLAQELRGDIYQLQGKKEEAVAAYTKALESAAQNDAYRRMISIKLEALGVDPAVLIKQ